MRGTSPKQTLPNTVVRLTSRNNLLAWLQVSHTPHLRVINLTSLLASISKVNGGHHSVCERQVYTFCTEKRSSDTISQVLSQPYQTFAHRITCTKKAHLTWSYYNSRGFRYLLYATPISIKEGTKIIMVNLTNTLPSGNISTMLNINESLLSLTCKTLVSGCDIHRQVMNKGRKASICKYLLYTLTKYRDHRHVAI